MKNANTGRRYHRIELNAPILITNKQGQQLHGLCLNFSEDSIEIEPDASMTLFNQFSLRAGDVVHLQIEQIDDAPTLEAAVVKASVNCIGLKFLL